MARARLEDFAYGQEINIRDGFITRLLAGRPFYGDGFSLMMRIFCR